MAKSSVELIVDASKAINPLKRVAGETRKLENAVSKAQNEIKQTNGQLRQTGAAASNAAKGVKTLNGAIGRLVGLFASIQTARFVFVKTAELETQTRSLQVLTGSLEDAQRVIKELQAFGRVTPFTSSELIETAKRLKAFGFETEKIVDVTKRLGDIAGATGADLGGIATAFGQIQAKGRLQGEELLQLQERGVDLQGELRKQYGLTADEFQKALSKGQIGADAVSFALTKLTEKGGKYADGAISQSDTLNGKFSTLQDNIEGIARTIGEVLTPALKGAFDLAIKTTNAINQALAAQSISPQERQGFKRQAEQEVRRFAGPMPGGAFGAGEVVVRHLGKTYKGSASAVVSQITNDLINQEVQRRASGQAVAVSTAGAADVLTTLTRPDLGKGSAAGKKAIKERADMSQRMLELNRKLRGEQEAGNEREIATLELMIRRQEIAESMLKTTERQNELEQALFDFRQKIFDIDEQDKQDAMSMDFAELFTKEQSKIKQFIEAGRQSLHDLEQVAINVSQGIGNAIANALTSGIQGLIDGSAKVKDVFANLLSSVGQTLAQEGAKMIATYIAIGVAKAFAGMPGFGEAGSFETGTGLTGLSSQSSFDATGLFSGLANGGAAKAGQPYMVGERGPELFVPGQDGGVMRNEEMRQLMGRSPAGAGAAPMNFTFETTNVGGTEYVSREQLEAAMATTRRQAANDGAKRGMSMTLDKMQNSPRTRSRIGIG